MGRMARAESSLDRQIREAEERGDFADLPGKGKPIAGIDRPLRDGEWIAAYARREKLPVTAMLPPALALAKELEDLPQTLATIRAEKLVRDVLTDLNRRIREARLSHLGGPPMLARPVDVEQVVRDWRTARP
jgi:hypothetical protein